MSHPYDEEALEGATMELFDSMRWGISNGYSEIDTPNEISGRETLSEVVLTARLLPALERLNPDIPTDALTAAMDELVEDRSVMDPTRANQSVYKLLKNGAKVPVTTDDGSETVETVRLIDWDAPANNDFYAVQQFWVTSDLYKRRPDVVGFVNGIPLVLLELKASHKDLKNGFTANVTDYKATVPQLFWFNALIIISNGSDARVGSVSAAWEHYAEWKRINSEGEHGVVSLETMLRGTCDRERLLDLVENFTVFEEVRGGLIKLVAKNHQYLGVNNAIEALHDIEGRAGRLGVFWHTQGSGKSVSMVFFTQKVLRKVPGNWTFVIVTDRRELDDQIYRTFQATGAVTEGHVQAESATNLQRLLREDHRYVFTLIHKFRTDRGQTHPMVSDRSDIVVITDEAHRTQYDTLALNMRNALPNASFLGFTGTPLIAGEERTREVFGDYVSIYDFKSSIDDGATVPLFYENRIPELQLTNEQFNEDMDAILEAAELDEGQEKKLARQFGREYHLITREERLDRIAADLVEHFLGRGFAGKAMMVSIDKATAVKMYDKVQERWQGRLERLRTELEATPDDEAALLREEIAFMDSTDMAVVVSQGQNEVAEMAEKGLDIVPHRTRMVKEDLETKFKDPDDPLRLVFVCAMWMTGFDVPSCSTIYLDKPMKNHTLMQTIARANRVWAEKNNGLIVDYVGVFRNLQRALAIYGSGAGGTAEEGETPVEDKSALVEALGEKIAETTSFCTAHGVSVEGLIGAEGFEYIHLRDDAVELLLATPDTKVRFLHLADEVDQLFKAILPDVSAAEYGPYRAVFVNLAEKIRTETTSPADITEVMGEVEALLDRSVAAKAYRIRAAEDDEATELIDLSRVDFDALAAKFATGRKYTQAERLKRSVAAKAAALARLNPTRIDYLERFQQLIDEYNAGSRNIESLFDELVKLAQELSEEEKRHIAEQLDEERLALFDILTRPEPELTATEQDEVKRVATGLLETLKKERLVLDWRKRQTTRAAVKLCIEETLDWLPAAYTRQLYQEKVGRVYEHVYESYWGEGRSIYSEAA